MPMEDTVEATEHDATEVAWMPPPTAVSDADPSLLLRRFIASIMFVVLVTAFAMSENLPAPWPIFVHAPAPACMDDAAVRLALLSAKDGPSPAVDPVYGPLAAWPTCGVTNLTLLFADASGDPDPSRWNVSAVSTLRGVFRRAASFDGNLSVWDVAAVSDLDYAFYGAVAFDGDLRAWDVARVTSMRYVFGRAESFEGGVESWDVSRVTSMEHAFGRAKAFDGDLSKWDISGVQFLQFMFYYADSFNGDVSRWNTANVISMESMFSYTNAFNQNLSQWNLTNVTSLLSMFRKALSFNQSLCWDTKSILTEFMFQNSLGGSVGCA